MRARFPQPLENACFCVRMGFVLMSGAFPPLPTAPTTVLLNKKEFNGNPVPLLYMRVAHWKPDRASKSTILQVWLEIDLHPVLQL